MFRKFILPIYMIVTVQCFAQVSSPDSFWNKVRYGGNLGLGFGNNTFNLQVAPSAIYEASPYYATGLGLQLNYSKFGENTFRAYGATWMNFVNPVPEIQLSAELEQWRVNLSDNSVFAQANEENYWLTALFLGIGYRTNNVTVGIRYDVFYDEDRSIYANPWAPFFRVFF